MYFVYKISLAFESLWSVPVFCAYRILVVYFLPQHLFVYPLASRLRSLHIAVSGICNISVNAFSMIACTYKILQDDIDLFLALLF